MRVMLARLGWIAGVFFILLGQSAAAPTGKILKDGTPASAPSAASTGEIVKDGTPASAPSAEDMQMLEKIHQATAQIEALSADFRSVKQVAFLEEPVLTQGRIFYARNQGIRWEILKPYRIALVYNGSNMYHYSAASNNQWEKQPADSDLVLLEVMKQLQAWFSGEAFGMHDMYVIKIVSRDPVRVVFVPRHSGMRKVLSELEFVFGKELFVVEKLKIMEGSGDMTTIHYQNIKVNPEIEKTLFQ